MKAGYPVLEPAVIGIDVLDVQSTLSNPLPRSGVYNAMRDATGTGEGGVNAGAIRAQHCLTVNQRQEHLLHMCRVQPGQLKVGGMPCTVAHHQHRDPVLARATRGPDTTASTRRAQQVALTLEGLQEEGLIGFDNAAFVPVAMLGSGAQKALSPQKGRVLVHTAGSGGLAHREAIDQGLGVGLPAIGLAQMRQGGAGQGIAGTAAGAASVTPQASTPAPCSQLRWRRLAMRARRQIGQALLPSGYGSGLVQYPQGGGSLCVAQVTRLCQSELKGLGVHGDLLYEWPTWRLLLQHVIGT